MHQDWLPAYPRGSGRFALRLIGWSLALFGLFRLPWVGLHIWLPATQLQAAAGAALLGPSPLPIEATLACSGADALALCLAAIAAYPARRRMRVAGLALATVGLLALNTVRIGTLGRAVASPRWFEALHLYVWPAVLTMAVAGFVLAWMRLADRPSGRVARFDHPAAANRLWRDRDVLAPSLGERRLADSAGQLIPWRFVLAAAVCLMLFTLAAPLYLESARVLAVAGLVARAAAVVLRGVGVDASAADGVLVAPRVAFIVTQECISTPLIPVYCAAVLVYARTWRSAALWAVAAPPLFVALGVARLLVVALPASIASSPAFMVHVFSQLLVAAAMVCGAALWRHGARATTYARALVALALAIALVRWLGAPYTRAILWPWPAAFDDPQGALRFLPAFQFGLFVALWVAAFVPAGWTSFAYGALLLVALQMLVIGGVQLFFLAAGVAPLVRDIRGWALVGPALVIALVVNLVPARR